MTELRIPLGAFDLLAPLARGGMGEVWQATHRMLARPAAIKLIRPEAVAGDNAAQRAILRRFEREAQATAALRSVHTIDVFDFGTTEQGAFYYVMEMLKGLDLDALVRSFGPVPPARAIHFLRQTCHSLREAHGQGLIHRDIKPANLYTCHLGPDFDFIKVLDFGGRRPEFDEACCGIVLDASPCILLVAMRQGACDLCIWYAFP